MQAFGAHESMSRQVLNDAKTKQGLLRILLGPARLYDALRED